MRHAPAAKTATNHRLLSGIRAACIGLIVLGMGVMLIDPIRFSFESSLGLARLCGIVLVLAVPPLLLAFGPLWLLTRIPDWRLAALGVVVGTLAAIGLGAPIGFAVLLGAVGVLTFRKRT